jgi:hypothetical protein
MRHALFVAFNGSDFLTIFASNKDAMVQRGHLTTDLL